MAVAVAVAAAAAAANWFVGGSRGARDGEKRPASVASTREETPKEAVAVAAAAEKAVVSADDAAEMTMTMRIVVRLVMVVGTGNQEA